MGINSPDPAPPTLQEIDALYERHCQKLNIAFQAGNLSVDLKDEEEPDIYPLFTYRTFRHAADYLTRAFSELPEVAKIVLFGSVAQPPQRENIRMRRRGWWRTWHTPKDLDLAVWLDNFEDLKRLQRARVVGIKKLAQEL